MTDPHTTADTDADAAVEAELKLLDPEVRRSPRRVQELLHPEFVEIGASGRVWDREAITALLAGEHASGDPTGTVSRMKAVRLAPDTVHLTYDTDHNGRRAHRSSLWRRAGGAWLLYFHQGTPYDADAVTGG
ncbi:nuclear transport factor 2 family protein [Streptomyces prasinus]|uniref:nuclear transport factor 2 family protein n=1 Tax=Streptomyces prasinus TaxID=67345 RepID=UPI003333AB19